MSVSGEILQQHRLMAQEMSFDTHNLPPGIYFVRLDNDEGTRIIKLAITR